MRQILLAVIALGAVTLGSASRSEAWVVGTGLGWQPPVVVAPAYPYAFYPGYPYPARYPYPYGYFRPYQPYAPYGYDGARNWRDTWQDDGTKVHGYTFR